MTLQQTFIQHLKKFTFIQKQQKQLLAVSGGVDSVVLCDLMFAAKYDFIIAHCNFQLRGDESERDENFVRGLGERYSKQVLVKKFDTKEYAENNKVSIQVAARELRYTWFNELLEAIQEQDKSENTEAKTDDIQLKPRYLFTAHHANDNIETVLMNFFKGTGIAGLHGILPKQGKIVRPLLFAKKNELLAYAKQHGLAFVEDSSNLSAKYTRNFFRHNLFPLLSEVYSHVEDNLLRNIQRLTETEELYRQAVELHKKKLLEPKGNEIHIPVLKLQKTVPLSTITYEIIKDFGFTSSSVQEVVDLLDSETGKYVSSATHRIIKNRNWLIISPNQAAEALNILIEKTSKKIVFSDGELSLEVSDAEVVSIPGSNSIAALDYAEVTFPLLLRRWKQGDYFYPLGMKKKKKLSRFFIDQKLSKTDKEKTWILEMNKKIIWIVGHRIDDRFKIKPSTKRVLTITYRA